MKFTEKKMKKISLEKLCLKFSCSCHILTYYGTYFEAHIFMTSFSKSTGAEWKTEKEAYNFAFSFQRRNLCMEPGTVFDEKLLTFLAKNETYRQFVLYLGFKSSHGIRYFFNLLKKVKEPCALAIGQIDIGGLNRPSKFHLASKLLDKLDQLDVDMCSVESTMNPNFNFESGQNLKLKWVNKVDYFEDWVFASKIGTLTLCGGNSQDWQRLELVNIPVNELEFYLYQVDPLKENSQFLTKVVVHPTLKESVRSIKISSSGELLRSNFTNRLRLLDNFIFENFPLLKRLALNGTYVDFMRDFIGKTFPLDIKLSKHELAKFSMELNFVNSKGYYFFRDRLYKWTAQKAITTWGHKNITLDGSVYLIVDKDGDGKLKGLRDIQVVENLKTIGSLKTELNVDFIDKTPHTGILLVENINLREIELFDELEIKALQVLNLESLKSLFYSTPDEVLEPCDINEELLVIPKTGEVTLNLDITALITNRKIVKLFLEKEVVDLTIDKLNLGELACVKGETRDLIFRSILRLRKLRRLVLVKSDGSTIIRFNNLDGTNLESEDSKQVKEKLRTLFIDVIEPSLSTSLKDRVIISSTCKT